MNLTSFTKISLKWITALNIKCKMIKRLENNIGEYLDKFGFGDDFLEKIPKALSMKEIIDKLDFFKIKNFCSAKDTVKRMKTQATD